VTRGRRATTVGGGLSLLFHAALVAALASRPHVSTTAEPSQSAVTIELQATSLEEPTPPPARETAVIAPRGHGTARSVPRRVPKVLTSFAHESAVTLAASLEPGEPNEDHEAEESSAAPAPVAALDEERSAPPTKTPIIAPDTARALRVYDTYPMLLAQAAVKRAEILVEVCVSDHGQVSDAVIAEGGMAAIDHTLRTAIRSWRYRPLVVNGAPTPFCHFMRIKYALN
jgi:TonB family protein